MSKEIRRDTTPFITNWEEGVTNAKDALIFVKSIEVRLNRVGMGHLEDQTILEVGAGNGLLANALRARGCSVRAIDARPRGEGVDCEVLEQLPDPDGTYSVVVGYGIFDSRQYVQDQQHMLNQIARVLQEGGLFIGFNVHLDLGITIPKILYTIEDQNNVGGLLLRKRINS